MHLGFGWGLIEALQQQRFDEARELILKGKGINKVDEFNQNPLLLALEAGRFDLARLLVEAGAEVDIESKMYKTPLQVAVQAGELNMVKLLLSKGASPDVPTDQLPPIYHALEKKHYKIARVLLESKCDLKRVYVYGNTHFTVGDLTVMARRPELTELVRRRGGDFTISP
jgi:ankyrin repeat protein